MKKDFATFLTYSGVEIDIKKFKKEDVNVDDIFHSLSMVNRFTGHSVRPYSVSEHSIYCYIVAKKLGLGARIEALALMHDASETYVNDMPTYIKQHVPAYREIEDKVESIIFEKIGLDAMSDEEKKIVKKIDNTLMLIEMRDLTRHDIDNIDLKDRDNYFNALYEYYGESGLIKWKKPIKGINLEFGSITDWLDNEKYVSTFMEFSYDKQLAYEKLMKHIYTNEIALRFGSDKL